MGKERLPEWFTPKLTLLLFCFIATCNYMDRGIIAANAVKTGIGELFGLNNFQYFLLPSVFMVGLLVASPIFAQLTRKSHPLFLMGVGMAVWVLATAGCGLAWSYTSLLVFRMIVGVGEASFICLAGPFIEEVAPPASKTTWLAVFYMCIPSGTALGYVVGGALTDLSHSWRTPFLIEAALMAPFAVMSLMVSRPAKQGSAGPSSTQAPLLTGRGEEEDKTESCQGRHLEEGEELGLGQMEARETRGWSVEVGEFGRQWLKDTREVLSYKVFAVACLGYIMYTVTTGVLLNAGPSAGAAIFPNDFQGWLSIDEFFGGVTILTGIVGTAAGGMLLDRLSPTMHGAMVLSAAFAGGSSALFMLCFNIHHLTSFIVVFVLGSLGMFAVSAPVNAAYMWSVPSELRPLSCALVIMCIHVFGDVPSPPLAGLLVDSLLERGYPAHTAWTIAMTIGFGGIGLAAVFWGIASIMARTAHDYRTKDTIEDVISGERTAPILQH
mmetsp:Transcript_6515/g.8840  ORF Transcript_6515/g.8840 Transcript_6515/m.8840 type:complete len:495 (+) Transcript_6515:68-1552(+)|eukprot:CAMPEP_0196572162 /NCGR_PEP_ID=MMETSP1081-20130531/2248_1 /TAXON_ID=36882 /ORGANISM="Pyramimonas amylifera, Strain CCMP720" /LENGTH=494 /DNA_ID=CAMNT_0041889375 /DNA_START=51 /DNA_END=1535 /DNA_ORIENTATION=-